MGIVTVLALGFVLGMTHALDADHMVAVSALVSRERSIWSSSMIGAFWGMGHSLSLFLSGGIILALKISIPPVMTLAMEMAVGIMLVFLGGLVAANLIRDHFHIHAHEHDGKTHLHLHSHSNSEPHAHSHAVRRGTHSMLVGMVHGLAGSAALMLLVVSNIRSLAEGFLYLLMFGAGSITGMMIISMLIGLPFVYSAVRFNGLTRLITGGASLASISLGVFLIYDIGIRKGLFG